LDAKNGIILVEGREIRMAYLEPGSEPPTKGKGSQLGAKMKIFVECFLADPQRNASRAVIEAGYKTKNPNRMATELLRHPLVKKAIDEGDSARRERMEFSADFLLMKLMAIINDPDVKTNDILRAIELAGKSIALWKERQEISGPDGDAIRVQEQRIEQEVNDFKSRIAGIAARGGAGGVLPFPKPGSSSES